MKHVLPFKQRQIEQRQLEAEADKQSRIRVAEGSAQARRIEAGGEADARQKLADAEAYRIERVGKVQRRADGARRRARHAASAADPEDAGRQALGQDPGDHRAAARRRRIHRRARCSATPASRRSDDRAKRSMRAHLISATRAGSPPRRAACTVVAAGNAIVTAGPDGAARGAARLGAAAGAAVAGRSWSRCAASGMDYLQVYDYRRERGGFVRASQVRRTCAGRRGSARAARGRALPARHAGRRSAGHRLCRSLPPGGAGRGPQRRGRQSKRWTRSAPSPSGWRGARPPAPCATRLPRPRCRRISRWPRVTASTFASIRARRAHARLLRRRCVSPRARDALGRRSSGARRAGADAAGMHGPATCAQRDATRRTSGAPKCSTASMPRALPGYLEQPRADAPRRRVEQHRVPARAQGRAAGCGRRARARGAGRGRTRPS